MAAWIYEVRTIRPTWESSRGASVPNGAEIVEAYLNGMGEQGWELVGFIPISNKEGQRCAFDPGSYPAVFRKLKDID